MSEYFEHLKDERPYGLEDAIVKILQRRKGIDQAIKKRELLEVLALVGFRVEERQARLSIAILRKRGMLIGSLTDGYFMCSNLSEYHRFRSEKMMSVVRDLLETVRILDAAAREEFGDAEQNSLFDLSEIEREYPELSPNGERR